MNYLNFQTETIDLLNRHKVQLLTYLMKLDKNIFETLILVG